jgi:DeoR family fructose operon transcriptional repressor
LTRRFGISAESVRKDLALLEARGLLRRVHGGAIPCEASVPNRTSDRGERTAEKSAIAEHALRFVPDGASLLLDAGTTLRLAEMLPTEAELVVYTNSIPVGSTLHRRGITVVTLGGRIRPPTMAGVGGSPPRRWPRSTSTWRSSVPTRCRSTVASPHPTRRRPT